MQPKVGIILINYKTYAKRFLEDCRDSMRKMDYPKDKYVVYIVDNATTPETVAYLKEVYPEAVVLPNAVNAGWGGGNNVGIEQAFKDGCEDIVLSNMDVIVHKDWLSELAKAAYSDSPPPQSSPTRGEEAQANSPPSVGGARGGGRPIGIVQSKLILWPIGKDGIQRLNSVGNQIHFLGFVYCKGYGEPDRPSPGLRPPSPLGRVVGGEGGEAVDIPYASGASMYVKGEVFKKIGLCNPDFFMYHDDMELCLKAKLVGYRVVLAPRSIMWHKYEFKRSIMQVYFMERNRLLTMLEFYKWPTLIILAPAFFALELGVLAGSIIGKYAKPKLRSWGYFFNLRNWKMILRDRKKIQTMRTISDRALTRDFTGKILFQEVMSQELKYLVNPIFNAYWQVAKRMMWW